MGEAMKFQINITAIVEADGKGNLALEDAKTRLIVLEPAKDLLGPVPDKPNGRTGLDKDLNDLIDFFRQHPDRPSAYVPKWDKDKAMLRPYVQAKGVARVREMLGAFVKRHSWIWDGPGDKFNATFIHTQPMTIQGFIAAADRLDVLMDWDTGEAPYG